MPGIDWTYLGALGGEGLEDFVATCLRQRYPDARQTRPAQGDGGVDVLRTTDQGLVVWQIKRFTTPLSGSQKQQVRRSWRRFWSTHVLTGMSISSYALATPWTPTDALLSWFHDELCADAGFPVRWEGQAFFNAMATDFPATADRFFKGQDMLENMLTAKALLASSPVERSGEISMVDAVAAREAALRDIRDSISDNYYIDSSTRTSKDEKPPLPSPDDLGLIHRYTRIGDRRWQVHSVVPKSTQSTEIEPLSLKVRFAVEPGSPQEDNR